MSSPKLTPRIYRWANLFRLGVAVFLLASALLGLTGCGSFGTRPVSQAVLNEAIAPYIMGDKLTPQLRKQLKLWELPGQPGNRLIVAHFNNSSDLCGAWGCLHVGFWVREDQFAKSLFTYYLDPPPPEKELFAPLRERDEQQKNPSPLPCFRLHQPGKSPRSFQRFDFCFQRGQYNLIRRQVVQIEKE